MKKQAVRWIQHTHLFRRDDYECSACGFRTVRPHEDCPRCASKMKGSEYDPSWVDEVEIMDAIYGD